MRTVIQSVFRRGLLVGLCAMLAALQYGETARYIRKRTGRDYITKGKVMMTRFRAYSSRLEVISV